MWSVFYDKEVPFTFSFYTCQTPLRTSGVKFSKLKAKTNDSVKLPHTINYFCLISVFALNEKTVMSQSKTLCSELFPE